MSAAGRPIALRGGRAGRRDDTRGGQAIKVSSILTSTAMQLQLQLQPCECEDRVSSTDTDRLVAELLATRARGLPGNGDAAHQGDHDETLDRAGLYRRGS